jgi:hypothetical protein
MTIQSVERLHYFQRQWLGAEDFEAQQEYHRTMRQRHNVAHHTPGIVGGLELMFSPDDPSQPTSTDLVVQPGMAVDGFGREIIVFQPVKVYGAASGSDDLPGPTEVGQDPVDVSIWIAYHETGESRPANGYEGCDPLEEYGRTAEAYGLVLDFAGADIDTKHTQIIVDGKLIDTQGLKNATRTQQDKVYAIGAYSDEGIPHQELPDPDRLNAPDADNWLIYLGKLKWDGNAFVKTTLDLGGRIYVSIVAEQVLAPNGSLRIRDRKTDPLRTPQPPGVPDPGVAVGLEGSLTIERLTIAHDDIQIHGHKLDLRDKSGNNTNSKGKIFPTTLERSNLDLQVTTGDQGNASDPTTLAHFTVGYLNGGAFKPVISVENTGKVSIEGALTVKDTLDVGGSVTVSGAANLNGPLTLGGVLKAASLPGDRIVLDGNADDPKAAAFGVDIVNGAPAIYQKAGSAHRWFINANHDTNPPTMELDAGGLNMNGAAAASNIKINGGLQAASVQAGSIASSGNLQAASAQVTGNATIG